jgi:hypothetical protein
MDTTMKLSTMTRRALIALALAPALALAACKDSATFSRTLSYEVALVVNSTTRSLSVIPADTTLRYSVGLGAEGSPVSVAASGNAAVVPMGTYPFAAVIDLVNSKVYYAPLPANSGATGAAFVNDSVVLVANTNLNSVSAVNVQTRVAAAPVAVGVFPQAVVAGSGRVFVLNANLVNFAPAGPGSVTVFDTHLARLGTVQLSGFNATAGVVVGTKLYVVNAGHYGQADGTLSVVDIPTLTETRLVTGFGEFPGSIAADTDGKVYVGVYAAGVLVWNPATQAFERTLLNPIKPVGSSAVSAVGFDVLNRLHVVDPGNCTDPGTVYIAGSGSAVGSKVSTGACPFALAFTRLSVKEEVTY